MDPTHNHHSPRKRRRISSPTPSQSPKEEGEAEASACVVCQEAISEKAVASPCGHEYDYVCILTWMEVKPLCPLCKVVIESRVSMICGLRGGGEYELIQTQHNAPAEPTPSKPILYSSASTHRRPYRPRRPRSPPPPSSTILTRRHIYKHALRSSHVGANRLSNHRNFTPATFLASEHLQSRARAFIRRELTTFAFLADNAEFVLEYVIAILKSVDLKSASGAAEDMLAEFLGRRNAGVFVHEVNAFLRSPYERAEEFDRWAQYPSVEKGVGGFAEWEREGGGENAERVRVRGGRRDRWSRGMNAGRADRYRLAA
ncbi:unnamed protein product [Tuber aestivum]|uniref:RING-type E3 ubiquitin transferase n=1 Tax=Tuber aestivum TaxID=59557 RepID=A0A292PV95_9PEZI|nr:unnamed protein product [Tuber aestivum]